jgi:hypothetical protein
MYELHKNMAEVLDGETDIKTKRSGTEHLLGEKAASDSIGPQQHEIEEVDIKLAAKVLDEIMQGNDIDDIVTWHHRTKINQDRPRCQGCASIL